MQVIMSMNEYVEIKRKADAYEKLEIFDYLCVDAHPNTITDIENGYKNVKFQLKNIMGGMKF